MAQRLIELRKNLYKRRICEPDKIHESLKSEIAVLMLTDVNYRTGRKHNIAKINKKAKDQWIITIWDLAHSAGA